MGIRLLILDYQFVRESGDSDRVQMRMSAEWTGVPGTAVPWAMD